MTKKGEFNFDIFIEANELQEGIIEEVEEEEDGFS